jgi:hypothetical protein
MALPFAVIVGLSTIDLLFSPFLRRQIAHWNLNCEVQRPMIVVMVLF